MAFSAGPCQAQVCMPYVYAVYAVYAVLNPTNLYKHLLNPYPYTHIHIINIYTYTHIHIPIGDVNADGFDDVIVSAPNARVKGRGSAGK
jgi:hypothetical protein